MVTWKWYVCVYLLTERGSCESIFLTGQILVLWFYFFLVIGVLFNYRSITMSGTKLISKTAKCELSVELRDFYKQNVTASSENCFDICKSTVAQSSSPKWFLERKLRITASKGHFIANERRTETRIKYFLTKIKTMKTFYMVGNKSPLPRINFKN